MLLSSQALWPIENSAVAHIRAMARRPRLKTSGLASRYQNDKLLFLYCGSQPVRETVFIPTPVREIKKVGNRCYIVLYSGE